ncbi:4-hydroxy-tetrahydrodipicolinate synthase [Bacillus sp. UMB0728]|uniref:4-hydroxy-tetrahydrodipicolinate synthase n=1 Tax=Bacillus sp. UMB0728 TaxID=2066052 RepID=UPI000C756594|nr:4-hydroxy-tetrahydrodipicolinate synthase [Bacillus sp. UMB0728]PLR73552.1 4-hydroxy-tetrahydrodipicolinate synthase [Bacillus sp. UMB0728]
MFKPNGIIPAMVTPFNGEGKVNEAALRRLAGNMIEAGCHGIFVLGSNGEFFSLSNEEKIEIARIVVDEVDGRLPVYAGTGGNSTAETISLTKQMEDAGVTAVSVITPYFVKLSQEELKNHFELIAEAVNIPIILYDIPGMTGNPLAPSTVKELAKVSNIVAIKDSSGSFDNVLKNLEAQGPEFTVLVGTDSLILPALMAGGGGAIAATANLLPKVVVSIYEKWSAGDLEGAELQQKKLRAIRNAFGKGTLPSVLKEAMNSAGLEVGQPRLPVKPLPEKTKLEVDEIVSQYRQAGEFD